MKQLHSILLIIQLGFGLNIYAATIESAASGNWNVGATWVGGNVPAPGDNVVIKNTHTVTISDGRSIIAITIEAGATLIIDGTLTSTGNIIQDGIFTINGTMNMNGGAHTLTVANSFSGSGTLNLNNTNTINSSGTWEPAISIINLYGLLNGNANFIINSNTNFSWIYGDLGLSNSITNNGTLKIFQASAHNTESNIINNGTINWEYNNFDTNGGGQTLTNNGTFNISSPHTCNMILINNGAINVTASPTITQAITNNSSSNFTVASNAVLTTTGNITQNGNFTVNGTMNMNGGAHTLTVANSFSGSGTLNLNNTNTINSSGTWEPAISIINLYGLLNGTANFTINSNTNFSWIYGDLGLSNSITNNGILKIFQASTHNTESNIINNGTINWEYNNFDTNGGGQTLTNNGTFNISSPHTCNMVLINNGTINVTSSPTITQAITNNSSANFTVASNVVLTTTGNITNNANATFIVAVGGAITIAGNITQSGTFTVNGTININGGTHSFDAQNSFSGTGTLNTNNTNIVNSSGIWEPAITTFNQYGQLDGTATLHIPVGSTLNMTGSMGLTNTITINGTFKVFGQYGGNNPYPHNFGSNIINNGTFNWETWFVDQNAGGQTFTNNGTFIVSASGSYINTIGMLFVNNGTVNVQLGCTFSDAITNNANGIFTIMPTGTLNASTNIIQSGTFTVNGILNLNGGTHTLNAVNSYSGSGTLNIGAITINSGGSWQPAIGTINLGTTLSGTVTLEIPSGTTFNMGLGGNFNLSQTITNNGTMNVNGQYGSSSPAYHNTESNIINNGTINWGTWYFDSNEGGQTLTNNGTFNIYNEGYLQPCNLILINAGTVNFNSGCTMSQAITNQSGATITVATGQTVQTQSGITQSGTFNVNGTLNLNGGTHTINVANSYSGSGTLGIGTITINSGVNWQPAAGTVNLGGTLSGTVTLEIPSGTTFNMGLGGNFNLSQTITNNGTMNVNGQYGSSSPAYHNTESNIINNGTINWGTWYFDSNEGGQTLTNNGTFNIYNEGYLQPCNLILINAGTVNFNSGCTMSQAITNQSGATITVATGQTVQTQSGITQSGTFNVNGTLNLNGGTHTINVANSYSGSGTLGIGTITINSGVNWQPAAGTVNLGGTLSGTVTLEIPSGTTFNMGLGGNFNLSQTITNNGTMNVNGQYGSSSPAYHNTESNIINNGTINWGTWYFDSNGGGQTLTNNGTFNIYNEFYLQPCNLILINAGTINFNSGCTMSQAITNQSGKSITVASGQSVIVQSDITQSGILIANGSLSKAGTGTLSNTGTIKGTGTLNVSGATFTNSGTVAPGLSPGTLNIVGNYTNSALALEINYSGGIVTKDSLYVSGNVTLGGSLVLTQTGNVPSGNYVFIKSGGTISGTFSSVTIPDCYTLEYGATTVTLKKGVAKVWDGTVNQWDEPQHWNPNGVPCPYDDVIINSGICELNITPDMKSLTINGGTLKKIDPATYAINVKTTVAAAGTINAFEGTIDFNDTLDNNGLIQGFANIDIINATMIGGYGKWGPGNSTGLLGCKGSYNGEIIEMEIGGNGGGTGIVEIDFLSVSQNMIVGGDLIIPWLGGTIPPGIRTIMECDGGSNCRTGTFNTITFPAQCPPGKCNIIYTPTQVRLENTEPIEFQGTCTWLGGTGNWSTVNKWSCNDVPNANDDVVINSGTVTLDINTTVKSLNFTGGSLTGDKSITVSNDFQWSGGSIMTSSQSNMGSANLSGTLTLSNTNMTLSQGGNFNNPTLTLSNNASITLPSGKTLTLNNQGTINNDNALNFVTNGTIIKNGSGVFTFKNPFVNNGITNITAGTIKYNNNFTSTGLLKGNGFIDFTAAGNVQIGPVNPGGSPGTFHVIGNYTNKHYLAEMLRTSGITTYDLIDVTANIQLQDSITIIKLAGEDIPYGTYTLMHCNGPSPCITGTFQTIKYPAFCNGADCNLMITGEDVKFVFQASLPAELIAFNAHKTSSNVRLDWTTASEVNVHEFIIERSSVAFSWTDLSNVAARGNSSSSAQYSFTDPYPMEGDNFYRLRIIDQDGSFKYSPIAQVAFDAASSFKIFPNPVSQTLSIVAPSKAEGNLWIVNSSGQTVIRQSLVPGENAQINVANLPAGLYAVCLPGFNCKTFVKE